MRAKAGQEKANMLQIKRLKDSSKLPSRGSKFSAGYDLYASESAVVRSKSRALVPTGIAISVPSGTYGRIAPRSGLAVKHGIDVGAGVIDEDFRSEIKVLLMNHGDADYTISAGDRIAQLIIEKISSPEVKEVNELNDTARGNGGFGSTGC